MALHPTSFIPSDAPVPPTLVWGPKRKWHPALTVLFVVGSNTLAWFALIRGFQHLLTQWGR